MDSSLPLSSIRRQATQFGRIAHFTSTSLQWRRRHGGHGVGPALMQAVEDCARSLRLTSVSLNTWLFNTEARDFYERLGYQRLNMQMRRRL